MSAAFLCTVEPIDLTGTLDQSLLDELAAICCFALNAEALTGDWEVALVLTTDEHIASLHKEFMQIATTTDIMTFPSDDEPGGDIVISVPQADRQRLDDGWDLPSELRFLVTHGALHLAGWDDATSKQRMAMLDRQREIVSSFA